MLSKSAVAQSELAHVTKWEFISNLYHQVPWEIIVLNKIHQFELSKQRTTEAYSKARHINDGQLRRWVKLDNNGGYARP